MTSEESSEDVMTSEENRQRLLDEGLVIKLPSSEVAHDLSDLIARYGRGLKKIAEQGLFVYEKKGFLVLPQQYGVLRRVHAAIGKSVKEEGVDWRKSEPRSKRLLRRFSPKTIQRVMDELVSAGEAIAPPETTKERDARLRRVARALRDAPPCPHRTRKRT